MNPMYDVTQHGQMSAFRLLLKNCSHLTLYGGSLFCPEIAVNETVTRVMKSFYPNFEQGEKKASF